MPELIRNPADQEWRSAFEPGQRLAVRERFMGVAAGQELEIVDAAEETAEGGDWPEWVAVLLADYESATSSVRPMPLSTAPLRQAIEDGTLAVR